MDQKVLAKVLQRKIKNKYKNKYKHKHTHTHIDEKERKRLQELTHVVMVPGSAVGTLENQESQWNKF